MIKDDWSCNFVKLSNLLNKLLEEVKERDFDWKCTFDWLLFTCLYDKSRMTQAKNKASSQNTLMQAFQVFHKMWKSVIQRRGGCTFEMDLFRLRIHLDKDNE